MYNSRESFNKCENSNYRILISSCKVRWKVTMVIRETTC